MDGVLSAVSAGYLQTRAGRLTIHTTEKAFSVPQADLYENSNPGGIRACLHQIISPARIYHHSLIR